jgi:hypothetical protein
VIRRLQLDWSGHRATLAGRVSDHLLIIGSPQVIPYHAQYYLVVQHTVGSIHFDAVDDYAAMREKTAGRWAIDGLLDSW